MNTNELIRDLENAANFCRLEAVTARRSDVRLADEYLNMATTFANAADQARNLNRMCVDAITHRITRAKATDVTHRPY